MEEIKAIFKNHQHNKEKLSKGVYRLILKSKKIWKR